MAKQGCSTVHITALFATFYTVQGQEYCEGKTFWCDKGHCCGRGKCCAYYYELWWFWLIWALIILLSCCCLYQQKRFRHRRNQSRRRTRGRNPNRSRIAQALDAAFITPIFDPDRVRLPTYDEAKDLPKDPPPYDMLYETRLPETSVGGVQPATARHINEAPQASLIENEEETAEATTSWREPPPPYTPTSPPLSPSVTSPPYTPTSPPLSPSVTSPPYTPFSPVPSTNGGAPNYTRAPSSSTANLPSVPVVSEDSQGQRSRVNVQGQKSPVDGHRERTTSKEMCANRPLQRTHVSQRSSETYSTMQRSSAGIQDQRSVAEHPQTHTGASREAQATSPVQGSSSSSANVPIHSFESSSSTNVPIHSFESSTSPSPHSSATNSSAIHNCNSQPAVISTSAILPSVSSSTEEVSASSSATFNNSANNC